MLVGRNVFMSEIDQNKQLATLNSEQQARVLLLNSEIAALQREAVFMEREVRSAVCMVGYGIAFRSCCVRK